MQLYVSGRLHVAQYAIPVYPTALLVQQIPPCHVDHVIIIM